MKFLLTLSFFIFGLSSFSQSAGYFGKVNTVEVNTILNSPIFYNYMLNANGYEKYGSESGRLVSRRNILDYGFRVSVGRTFIREFGLHLEGGVNYFSAAPIYFSGNYSSIEAEMFSFRQNSIMPKIEFTTIGGGLPLGLSNQIGFGLNYYNPIQRDYLVTYSDYNFETGNKTVTVDPDRVYDLSLPNITGYTLMYKLNMRIPITKELLVNIGFRYSFNFVPDKDEYYITYNDLQTGYMFSPQDLREMIKYKENKKILNFETGITYAF